MDVQLAAQAGAFVMTQPRGLIGGTRGRTNANGAIFTVDDIEARDAVVVNTSGPARQIPREAMRSTAARAGYTRLHGGTAPNDRGAGERP